MSEVTWILVFYVIGVVAMAIEIVVPGVVMGVIGFLVMCGSIVYAFATHHPVLGAMLVGLTIVFIPLFFVLWKNVFGRVLAFSENEKDFASSKKYGELVGKEGEALSALRPSGTVMIDDKRYQVVTRGEMLDKGTPTRVIEVTGSRIVVRKV